MVGMVVAYFYDLMHINNKHNPRFLLSTLNHLVIPSLVSNNTSSLRTVKFLVVFVGKINGLRFNFA